MVILYKPVLCETCGNYIENNTYFATDIGQVVTQGIGYCSVGCWRQKLEDMRRVYRGKMHT